MFYVFQKWSLALVLFAVAFTACKKDDDSDSDTLQIPSTYTSPNFETNAAAELQIIDEMDAFLNYLGTVDSGSTIEATTAYNLWNGTNFK